MIDVMSSAPMTLNGSCHCGAVQFTAELPQGLASARRCTCSICRMRGAIAVTGSSMASPFSKAPTSWRLIASTPRSPSIISAKICGIYTHHKRRSNPNELGVNVACLQGISPFDFEEDLVYDGQRHPGDNPTNTTYTAGVLRFEPALDG